MKFLRLVIFLKGRERNVVRGLKKGGLKLSGIILFDGMCNLCSTSVQFIIKRDQKGYFSFASLQSDQGKELSEQYQIPNNIESIVVIDNGRYYLKSSAALYICKHLDGMWKFFSFFRVVPRPLRDKVYDYIAKNRYRWFGKKDACMIPTPEMRSRFIDSY